MRLSYVFPFLFALGCAACVSSSDPTFDDGPHDGVNVERPPRTLAKFPDEATVAIAVDDTHVYATTSRDPGGSVVKVPLGGGAPEVLTTMNPKPFAIAVSDGMVYFTVRETGRIHRVATSGGPVEVVAEPHERSNGAEAIAVSGEYVYWSAVGGIFRAPKKSTAWPAERIAEENEGADAIAALDDEVIWIARGTADRENGALYKVATTGGERVALGTGDIFRLTWGFSIAARGPYVFVPDPELGRVYRVERATGAITAIASGQDHPIALAVDDRRVYWSTGGVDGARSDFRTLSAAPIEGGDVEVLVRTRQANIHSIATNGRGVFFTDYTTTGSLFAAP